MLTWFLYPNTGTAISTLLVGVVSLAGRALAHFKVQRASRSLWASCLGLGLHSSGMRQSLDQRGLELLDVDQGGEADQRITARGQSPVALIEIKQPRLPC